MSKKAALDPWHGCFKSEVLRCAFDTESLTVKEVGHALTLDTPRGLYEPSVIYHGGEYFICLRNDITGYMAKSRDGLNYGAPHELIWDTGESVGNYNTQQTL